MSCLNRSIRHLAVVIAAACARASIAQGVPAGTEADLTGRAQAWLSGRHQVQASAIGVHPLDARVQGRGCAGGWQFDQPVAGNDSMLRARCPDNNWQVYLRVMLPPRPATQGPAQAQSPAFPSPSGGPPAGPGAMALSANTPPAPAIVMPPQPPAPPLVRRGQSVLTTWASVPGLVVSARMEALDEGRMGDTIRLRNRETGRIVSGIVSGQNTAQAL